MPTAPTVSEIIRLWKQAVSKQIGFSLWQKSFYDHIIRNESEYLKITRYIEQNPMNWANDSLFKAETEADLKKLEELGVSIMQEAIEAYRSTAVSPEFLEIERMRSKARHNEASALRHAEEQERAKWQIVVADKDATIAVPYVF